MGDGGLRRDWGEEGSGGDRGMGGKERSVPIGSLVIIPAESQVIPDWRSLPASW